MSMVSRASNTVTPHPLKLQSSVNDSLRSRTMQTNALIQAHIRQRLQLIHWGSILLVSMIRMDKRLLYPLLPLFPYSHCLCRSLTRPWLPRVWQEGRHATPRREYIYQTIESNKYDCTVEDIAVYWSGTEESLDAYSVHVEGQFETRVRGGHAGRLEWVLKGGNC